MVWEEDRHEACGMYTEFQRGPESGRHRRLNPHRAGDPRLHAAGCAV